MEFLSGGSQKLKLDVGWMIHFLLSTLSRDWNVSQSSSYKKFEPLSEHPRPVIRPSENIQKSSKNSWNILGLMWMPNGWQFSYFEILNGNNGGDVWDLPGLNLVKQEVKPRSSSHSFISTPGRVTLHWLWDIIPSLTCYIAVTFQLRDQAACNTI